MVNINQQGSNFMLSSNELNEECEQQLHAM